MAWTVTKKIESVFGNIRVKSYLMAADSATYELDTGFGDVLSVATAPKSMASSPYAVAINVTTAAVASPGTVAVTGVTSGDDFWLTVYGR